MADEEVQSGLGGALDPPMKIKRTAEEGQAGQNKRKSVKKTAVTRKGGTRKKTTAKKTPAKKKNATKKPAVRKKIAAKKTVGKQPADAENRRIYAKRRTKLAAPAAGIAGVGVSETDVGRTSAASESASAATAPPVSVLEGARFGEATTKRVTVAPPPTVLAEVQPAILKVRNVDAQITSVTAHVIANKVVVQGRVHLQSFYVTADEMVHHLGDDASFSVMLEIPGAAPGMEAIVEPFVAGVLFHLSKDGKSIVKKVIIDVFAKVVEEVQLRPVPGLGPMLRLQEVVGEGTGQRLCESSVILSTPAIKVEEIVGKIVDITSEVIPDKVIVQGRIHKQIFFVGEDNVGHHQAEDVQFSVFVDIPGAQPGMNVQVHPTIETILFELTSPTTLRQKVVVAVFAKITTPVHFQAALGDGPLLRVPAIVGEGRGQILRRDVVTLERPASKVREIVASLTGLQSHVITGKAILQGTIHKQIYYVGPDEVEFHQAADVPFNMMVEIPGAAAGLDLVVEPVIETVLFDLQSPTQLEEKVLISADLTVVEQRQVHLAMGAGHLVKVQRVVGENLKQVLVVSVAVAGPHIGWGYPVKIWQEEGARVYYRRQTQVESVFELPHEATEVAKVQAEIENLDYQYTKAGIIISGDVRETVTYIGTDQVLYAAEFSVPFTLFVPAADVSIVLEKEEAQAQPKSLSAMSAEEQLHQLALLEKVTTVQIERILSNIGPDGRSLRQIMILVAFGDIRECAETTFDVWTAIDCEGVYWDYVMAEGMLVQADGSHIWGQYKAITKVWGPGVGEEITDLRWADRRLKLVGDGEQIVHVLEYARYI